MSRSIHLLNRACLQFLGADFYLQSCGGSKKKKENIPEVDRSQYSILPKTLVNKWLFVACNGLLALHHRNSAYDAKHLIILLSGKPRDAVEVMMVKWLEEITWFGWYTLKYIILIKNGKAKNRMASESDFFYEFFTHSVVLALFTVFLLPFFFFIKHSVQISFANVQPLTHPPNYRRWIYLDIFAYLRYYQQ